MLFIHLFVAASGIRFGEATNPGPSSQETFAVGTFNPTCLGGKAHLLGELPKGVWGASETHVTREGYAKFQQEIRLQDQKYSFVHGHFAPPVSSSIGSYGGKATGVGIISSYPLRALTHSWPNQLWSTGRLHAGATLIGDNWLKLGIMYGYAHNPHLPSTIQQTDEILAALVDRLVHQSYGYRVLMGDFNHSQGVLSQQAVLRQAGWIELQEYAHAQWGRPVQCTFKDKSTIDFVWVSPEMIPLIQDVVVDATVFPEHSVVYGVFTRMTKTQSIPVWRKPFPLPWSEVDENLDVSPEINVADDPDMHLQQMFIAVEQSVDANLRTQGKPGLLAQTRGRCATKEPVWKKHPVTPVKPPVRGSPDIEFHGENFQYTKWVRQLRRLHSLVMGLSSETSNPSHIKHMHDLWDSIRAAPGFPRGFPRAWQDRTTKLPGSPTHLPKRLPSKQIASAIFASFEADFRQYETLLNRHRVTQAKERRRTDPTVIFKDVKKAQSLPVQTVVLQSNVEVTEVDDSSCCIRYHPQHLRIDEPVKFQGTFLDIQEHVHGTITTTTKPMVAVGDLLCQDKMVGDLDGVFRAFHELWHPIWNRHEHSTAEEWEPTLRAITELPMQSPGEMVFPPIDYETWMHAVQTKKPHSAVGPDGVSREDLLRMPRQVTNQIIQLIADVEAGLRPWPKQVLVGHITAIEKHGAAAAPSDYRPICVLSMIYRTWGSIRSKQMLAWIDRFAPKYLMGNRPGHSTMDIWHSLALMVEGAAHDDSMHVAGLVTDICKCFNTLHRPMVYACARRCGFPASFLQVWFQAVQHIRRSFVVTGACSAPLHAVTGFPEGDSLSVVSMACVNVILHEWVGSQLPRSSVISYVDNWEVVAQDPHTILTAWEKLQTFGSKIDVRLDHQKTYTWATNGSFRKVLRTGNTSVKLAGRDLGGHLHYSKKRTMFTIRGRIDNCSQLWGSLARSLAPVRQKMRMLSTVAWPRCFYGISVVPIGSEHVNRLRTKAMQSLRWNKKGASPIIQLSLVEHMTHDPGYHILQDTVVAFRRSGHNPEAYAILDTLCATPLVKPAPGPCSVLLERLHEIGWSWEGNGWVRDHCGFTLHLIDSPIQLLMLSLQWAWAAYVGGTMASRDNFAGLAQVDRQFTMAEQKNWSDEQSAIMRTALNGTFFTRDKQIHSGHFDTKTCPWCQSEDSIYHRYWECQHFDDLRNKISQEDREEILSYPECTFLRGWFTTTPTERQWAQELQQLPDTSEQFESVDQVVQDLHFFVDGGCHRATEPALRLGTWAIACADLETDSFLPIAQGFTPGRLQTAMRSEIVAASSAVLCGLRSQRKFTIWTDNQTVYEKINKWIKDPGPDILARAKDSDLWSMLRRRVVRATQLRLLQFVCKVRSHQDPALYSDAIERWVFRGNNFVDKMTADVLQSMPPRARQAWAARTQEYERRVKLRRQLHTLIYEIGSRAIAGKSEGAQLVPQRAPTTADTQQMLDEQQSFEPLPLTLQGLTLPANVAEHGQQILDWLRQLLRGDHRHNRWMTSYQLLAHYQFTTGQIGYMYSTKTRKYEVFRDSESGPYNFVKAAAWFVGMVKCLCKHFLTPCVVDYRPPAGATFLGWHRCLLLRVNSAVIEQIDRQFMEVGIRNVKKIHQAFSGVDGFWPKA